VGLPRYGLVCCWFVYEDWVWSGLHKERLGVVWVCLGKAGFGVGLFGKGWVWFGFV